MPIGTEHTVTGLLLLDRGRAVLDADNGGTWSLDGGGRLRRLMGQRVTIVGVRAGFDLLEVRSAVRAD